MIHKKYAVFIPCYNAASTIIETIASVQKSVLHTGADIPVFIHDDYSTDNSFALVSDVLPAYKNFHIIRNEQNAGERKTTNAAFKKFADQFNWVFIIHADDIVKEDWLQTLIAAIEAVDDRSCFTVWSSFDTFNENGILEKGDDSGAIQHIAKNKEAITRYISQVSSSWHISGCAVNVNIYLELKGFDEGMPQFGDTDFFVKGLLAGHTDVYISRTLTLYRILTRSVSGVSFRTNRDIREIYILLNRYQHLLSKKQVAGIYRLITRISARRTIKWLLKWKLKLAFMNLRQCSQSMYEWSKTSFKTVKPAI